MHDASIHQTNFLLLRYNARESLPRVDDLLDFLHNSHWFRGNSWNAKENTDNAREALVMFSNAIIIVLWGF